MNRLYVRAYRNGLVLGLMALVGCAPAQLTTVTIYETPQSFVRLEIDRNPDQDTGHAHPSDMTPEHMVGLLRGLVFEEPVAKLPFYDDLDQPRRHPALTESEVTLFAPLLATALKKASPDEIVTFYHSTTRSSAQRLVTSGSIFMDQDMLHIVFANYRSPTHFSADIGVADTADERLTPLRALAPQRGRLEFEPHDVAAEPDDTGVETWFQPKRLSIALKYKRVPPGQLLRPSPRPTSEP